MRDDDYMYPWKWDKQTWKDLTPCGLLLGGMWGLIFIVLWLFQ